MNFEAFICCALVDRGLAENVLAGLEAAGISCVIAPREIRHADRPVMVLLFTRNAAGAAEIEAEVERAAIAVSRSSCFGWTTCRPAKNSPIISAQGPSIASMLSPRRWKNICVASPKRSMRLSPERRRRGASRRTGSGACATEAARSALPLALSELADEAQPARRGTGRTRRARRFLQHIRRKTTNFRAAHSPACGSEFTMNWRSRSAAIFGFGRTNK